jgi:hypothetical protein
VRKSGSEISVHCLKAFILDEAFKSELKSGPLCKATTKCGQIYGGKSDGLLRTDELQHNDGSSALTSGFNIVWILASTK